MKLTQTLTTYDNTREKHDRRDLPDALRRLEVIVAELERGGMDLEATSTVRRRFELLERCQAELKEAEDVSKTYVCLKQKR